MKRLFIAVPIAESSRNQIIRGIFNDGNVRRMPVRWTSYANLHLTLQFLGDVEEKRVRELSGILNSIRTPERPSDLVFTGVGVFPNASAPRIIWLGIAENRELLRIHRELTTGLKQKGFPFDSKPFKPHLTLGRVRNDAELPAESLKYVADLAAKTAVSPSPLTHITLFESSLRPGGPIYTRLDEKEMTA